MTKVKRVETKVEKTRVGKVVVTKARGPDIYVPEKVSERTDGYIHY